MVDIENQLANAESSIPLSDESSPPKALRTTETNKSARMREAAAMVALFSVFATVEGIVRAVTEANRDPEVPLTARPSLADIPGVVLLAAGVAEVIFGLAGLYLSFYAFLAPVRDSKKFAHTFTFPFLILQAVLGWFVFIVYVLAVPIALAIHLPEGRQAAFGLSPAVDRANIILGFLLGSVSFCWALQGGQFTMALRLYKVQTEDENAESTDCPKANATRAYVWTGNFIAAAISTIFVGSSLIANNFPENGAAMPFAPYAPHVVWYPSLSLVTGLVMLAWGVLAIMAVRKAEASRMLLLTWPLVGTLMVFNFSLVFGRLPGFGPPIAGAAQHFGLVMSTLFLPLYFSLRVHHATD